jgi:hypothetical protein
MLINAASAERSGMRLTGCRIGQASRLHRLLLFLLCLLSLLPAGCVRLIGSKPEGPWYEAYQPIDDEASQHFISQALDEAVRMFGEPVFPVNQIILRRSRKSDEARFYCLAEDFSLTECIDPENGIFVIYIGVDPDHENYYALLGHECAHLLNPFITDWYMEGLATLFSGWICEELGKDWGTWTLRFERLQRDPYAVSFRMMEQLHSALPEAYYRIPGFAVTNGRGDTWLKVDIDAWMNTLSETERKTAREIIRPCVSVLRKNTNRQYGFAVPAGLQ